MILSASLTGFSSTNAGNSSALLIFSTVDILKDCTNRALSWSYESLSGGFSSRSRTPSIVSVRVKRDHDLVELGLLTGDSPRPEVSFCLDEPGFELVGPESWEFDHQCSYFGFLGFLCHVHRGQNVRRDLTGKVNEMRLVSVQNHKLVGTDLFGVLRPQTPVQRVEGAFIDVGCHVRCPWSLDPGRGHQWSGKRTRWIERKSWIYFRVKWRKSTAGSTGL